MAKNKSNKQNEVKIRFRDGKGQFRPAPGTVIPKDIKPHPFEEPKLGYADPLLEDCPCDRPPKP
jgi:hypothetical protein